MATTKKKAPRVTAVYGELQGSPVVRFDVKSRGDAVTIIVGLDQRSVQAYFGKPGLVATGTGVTPPKGPKGVVVDVFAAAPKIPPKTPSKPRKPKKPTPAPVPLGDDPPPIKPPN